MILDYRAELERRIEQFHRYLEPMDRRAHEDARGPCYTVFENRHLRLGREEGRGILICRSPGPFWRSGVSGSQVRVDAYQLATWAKGR